MNCLVAIILMVSSEGESLVKFGPYLNQTKIQYLMMSDKQKTLAWTGKVQYGTG